ncbi:MAG TPA: M48 family metalloprotease [Porticoccaceae bacterium]|nr:M48 family metalloprotease [Porticoccaceae bacterium]
MPARLLPPFPLRSRVVRLALLLPLALLVGCAVNPVTGEQQLSLVSDREEIQIGEQQYEPAQQSQGGRYYLDPALQDYVRRVGDKLAAVSDRRLPYEFAVLDNPVPNAWALPGGKIAVNSGLLLYLKDEAELASVLGHEIVHAAARHSAAQMSKGSLIGLGAQIAGIVSQQSGYGNLGGMAAQAGAAAWMASYGRGAELESDAYGMEYMVRAGYDPQAAVSVQETFVKLSAGRQPDFLSGLFASHPPSQARVEANRGHASRLGSGGLRNATAYQRATAQLRHDAPAYEAEKKALAALAKKDSRTAIRQLDAALKIQPNAGRFWELRGHAWAMQKEWPNALDAFSTAIDRNPGYFRHYLARGALHFERREYAAAKRDLERSRQLLPTALASLYLGEIALANGADRDAAAYYREAANDPGPVGQKARERLSGR